MKKIQLFFLTILTTFLIGGCAKAAENINVDEQAIISDALAETDEFNSEDGGEIREEAVGNNIENPEDDQITSEVTAPTRKRLCKTKRCVMIYSRSLMRQGWLLKLIKWSTLIISINFYTTWTITCFGTAWKMLRHIRGINPCSRSIMGY